MKSTDIALVLFMNLAFGASFISAKIGVSYFPPFLFTSMRFLIIAILLLPFLKLHQGQMFNILFISLLGGAFHFAFFYLALDNSTHISSVRHICCTACLDCENCIRQRNWNRTKL